jgi:hypothetical protein
MTMASLEPVANALSQIILLDAFSSCSSGMSEAERGVEFGMPSE